VSLLLFVSAPRRPGQVIRNSLCCAHPEIRPDCPLPPTTALPPTRCFQSAPQSLLSCPMPTHRRTVCLSPFQVQLLVGHPSLSQPPSPSTRCNYLRILVQLIQIVMYGFHLHPCTKCLPTAFALHCTGSNLSPEDEVLGCANPHEGDDAADVRQEGAQSGVNEVQEVVTGRDRRESQERPCQAPPERLEEVDSHIHRMQRPLLKPQWESPLGPHAVRPTQSLQRKPAGTFSPGN
jgi:hypothetical protein